MEMQFSDPRTEQFFLQHSKNDPEQYITLPNGTICFLDGARMERGGFMYNGPGQFERQRHPSLDIQNRKVFFQIKLAQATEKFKNLKDDLISRAVRGGRVTEAEEATLLGLQATVRRYQAEVDKANEELAPFRRLAAPPIPAVNCDYSTKARLEKITI